MRESKDRRFDDQLVDGGENQPRFGVVEREVSQFVEVTAKAILFGQLKRQVAERE